MTLLNLKLKTDKTIGEDLLKNFLEKVKKLRTLGDKNYEEFAW